MIFNFRSNLDEIEKSSSKVFALDLIKKISLLNESVRPTEKTISMSLKN